jgi:phosphate transport system substrate-binding protein
MRVNFVRFVALFLSCAGLSSALLCPIGPSSAQAQGQRPLASAATPLADSRLQARVELLAKSYAASPGGQGRLYSTAYNAYWSRRYDEALVHFAAATVIGDDPRAWIYRGLSETALGDNEAGVRSIRRGWMLAGSGRGGSGLPRALERVQGSQRRWLESLKNEPAPLDVSDRAMMVEMEKRLERLERQLADANRQLAESKQIATAAPTRPAAAPRPPMPVGEDVPGPDETPMPAVAKPTAPPEKAVASVTTPRSSMPRSAVATKPSTPKPTAPKTEPTPAPVPVNPNARVVLKGSGATFPASLYARWFKEYQEATPDIRIDYTSQGSGAGVRSFVQSQVDFGASDAAMTDEEISQVPNGVVLVPVTAGSIVIAYNLEDGPAVLKLSRDAYSKIFLDEIQNWNDPAIAACNPGVTLPDLDITVVRRSVSSGTTFVFTRHLTAISEAWSDGPGTGTTVAWPVGVPSKTNADLATRIRQTPGAIGYVELSFATESKLAIATLENRAGNYVAPEPANTQESLGEVVLPANLRGFVSDPKGDQAYPIVSYTWLLCYQRYDDAEKAAALKQLIAYCLTTGQKAASEMGFIPLPGEVAATVASYVEENVGRSEVVNSFVSTTPTEEMPAEVATPVELKPVALRGSGATFPAKLYERWFKAFSEAHPGVTIEYASLGSGAGVRNFIARQGDFGASDSAMSDEEISQVPEGVVLVPVTAGSIALAYNLPGVEGELKLSREAYSGIFLGEVTRWNDPRIASTNPDLTLPDLEITVVRRGVSSGTTFVFTRHLSAISTPWEDGPGSGTTVEWPVGVPAKKNSDVAERIRQTPGAIGYVETGYAAAISLAVASLENQAGQFVPPLPENTRVSLGEVVLPENLRGFVSDPKDPAAYPIISYTWLLCHRSYEDQATAEALRALIRFCLTEGQKDSAELGYIPIPDDVAATVLRITEPLVGNTENR